MRTSEARMRTVSSPAAMRRLSARWRARGLSVGFVPTMGALHRGHLSLVERARAENDRVVVSVFVNPTQFGPQEDFSRYPRPFRRDASLCRKAGADALYHPAPGVMYPPGFSTFVEIPDLSAPLCGRSRPGHFRGVATVVLKLLNQVSPDRLYLGEKDFQQLTVLRRMVRDLDLPVAVRGCRIHRERDGLAMSSRNAYLTPQERALAPRLRAALGLCAAAARRGSGRGPRRGTPRPARHPGSPAGVSRAGGPGNAPARAPAAREDAAPDRAPDRTDPSYRQHCH